MPDDAEIREAKERMVTASKLASSWLGGYLAARHDGNRAHIEESLAALKSALTEDLTEEGPNRGALTEAFLIVVGELTRIMLEKTAGDDIARQVRMVVHAWNDWAASMADEVVTPEVVGRPGERPSHLRSDGVLLEVVRADVLRPADPVVDGAPAGSLVVKLVAASPATGEVDINVVVSAMADNPDRPDWSTFRAT